MAGLGTIARRYREALVTESSPGFVVRAAVVGSPVREALDHSPDDVAPLGRAAPASEDTCQSAHGVAAAGDL